MPPNKRTRTHTGSKQLEKVVKKKKDADGNNKLLWFVIYCEKDKSVVAVEETEVIFEENVQKKDRVRFFSNRQLYDGVVEDFSLDKRAMFDVQDKLNALKKKEDKQKENSFHEEVPRKAAVKARQLVDSTFQMSAKEIKTRQENREAMAEVPIEPSSSEPVNPEDWNYLAEIGKNDVIGTYGNDEMGCASNSESELNSDASDSFELNEEELALLKKIQSSKIKSKLILDLQKVKNNNKNIDKFKINAISSHTSFKKRPHGGSSEKEKTFAGVPPVSPNTDKADSPSVNSIDDNDSSDTSEVVKTEVVKRVAKRLKVNVPPGKKFIFTGKMFRYTEADESTIKLEELIPKSKIFESSKDLEKVKSKSSTPTAFCRKLLTVVFSDEALLQCSVGGNVSTGTGRDNIEQRSALDESGVKAIVSAVEKCCFKKKKQGASGWECPSVANLRSKMGARLCELRADERARKLVESMKAAAPEIPNELIGEFKGSAATNTENGEID